MKRFAALIVLIMFLGIGFSIYAIFRQESQPSESVPTETTAASPAEAAPLPADATPAPTATPTMPPTPTPSPIPTMPPTPSPTPTPEPTPVPTPTPVIVREDSGSFRTDTGKFLNLIIKYNVKRQGDSAVLTVDAYSESYGLETVKRLNDLCFVIDGVTTYVSTGPIHVTDNSNLTETLLGTAEAEVRPGSNVRVDVTWVFNGTISGEELPEISASSTIAIP